ncbi:MAG: hypothetical protein IT553_04695 [Sphingomonadaceae bacterium]|nr:hypothetical protein [Sphingomonadaceae bacterium]
MKGRTARLAALLLFLLITVTLAALGGGWLALGRLDPLFMLPGLGWAVFAATSVHRGDGREALGWAAALTLVSALSILWLAVPGTAMPWGAWGILFLGSWALLCAWVMAAAWLMRRGAARWLRLLLGVMAAIIWVQAMGRALPYAYVTAPPSVRPHVALISALPLGGTIAGFGADGRLGMPMAPSPMYSALARDFALRTPANVAAVPRDITLLLIQPPALAPADLVALDAFVRGGGRAIILADGLYSGALAHGADGRANAAPVTSLLTPLLSHWGLELDAPDGLTERAAVVHIDGEKLQLFSPGRFRTISADGACRLLAQSYIADCRIGAGRALLISDADMVDAALWHAAPGEGAMAARSGNARWLAARLAALGGVRPPRALAWPIWRR